MKRARGAAVACWLVSGVLAVAGLVLLAANRHTIAGDTVERYLPSMAAIAFSTVGLLIVWARAGNAVGWVMLSLAAALSLNIAGSEYALTSALGSGLPVADAAAYAQWLANPIVLPALGGLALLFPSGEMRTLVAKALAWLLSLGLLSALVASWFTAPATWRTVLMAGGAPTAVELAGPLLGFRHSELVDGVGRIADDAAFLLVAPAVLAALIRLLVRFFRSTGVERLQMQWLAYALLLGSALLLLSLIPPLAQANELGGAVLLIGGPTAIGVAVTKYRLYEIDRVISRTLGYALVTGFLAFVYVGGAVWIPGSVLDDDSPPVFVAASTLAAAAVFRPVRRRILEGVDRRFYRSRYDAARIAEAFSDRWRDDSVGRLFDDWMATVDAALRPVKAQVWLAP